jgi:pyridinium-3,5-biscarboxylic acid mononucleotide synthase
MPTTDPHAIDFLSGLQLDLGRAERCGFPEVVYGPGKSIENVVEAFEHLHTHGQSAFITRATEEQATSLCRRFPTAIHNALARTVRLPPSAGETPLVGKAWVVAAGTSDRPIAEEALETLHWMRVECELIIDIGVAGPQRLLKQVPRLREADTLVVVAGMEGALPSVVGGWVACPIFAVPTSVGYGASFQGLAALLAMLNSCAANIAVVNIDAGFKAGYMAGLVARRTGRDQSAKVGSEAG